MVEGIEMVLEKSSHPLEPKQLKAFGNRCTKIMTRTGKQEREDLCWQEWGR